MSISVVDTFIADIPVYRRGRQENELNLLTQHFLREISETSIGSINIIRKYRKTHHTCKECTSFTLHFHNI